MEQYICPLVKFVRLFRTLIAKKKEYGDAYQYLGRFRG